MNRESCPNFSLSSHLSACPECQKWYHERKQESKEDSPFTKGFNVWEPTQDESESKEKLDKLNSELRDLMKEDYDIK